jgi:RNA polymerase subunit RPABC4/transcription elongation factor Spt4
MKMAVCTFCKTKTTDKNEICPDCRRIIESGA